MAEKKATNRRGRCRFCAQEQPVLPNDTLADHDVSRETPRRCFGSGMGAAP